MGASTGGARTYVGSTHSGAISPILMPVLIPASLLTRSFVQCHPHKACLSQEVQTARSWGHAHLAEPTEYRTMEQAATTEACVLPRIYEAKPTRYPAPGPRDSGDPKDARLRLLPGQAHGTEKERFSTAVNSQGLRWSKQPERCQGCVCYGQEGPGGRRTAPGTGSCTARQTLELLCSNDSGK